MASSNDLIKYFTQEVVRYLDTPKEERRQKTNEPTVYHWFGFMPLAIRMSTERNKKQFKHFLNKLHTNYVAVKNKIKR